MSNINDEQVHQSKPNLIQFYNSVKKPSMKDKSINDQIQRDYNYIKLQEWESFQAYNATIKDSLDSYKISNNNPNFIKDITTSFKRNLLNKLSLNNEVVSDDQLSFIDDKIIKSLLDIYYHNFNQSIDQTCDDIIDSLLSNIYSINHEFNQVLHKNTETAQVQAIKTLSELKKVMSSNKSKNSSNLFSNEDHQDIILKPKAPTSPQNIIKPINNSIIKIRKKPGPKPRSQQVTEEINPISNDQNNETTIMSNGFIRGPKNEQETNRNSVVKAVKACQKRDQRLEALRKASNTKIRTFTQSHIADFKQPSVSGKNDGHVIMKFTFSQKHANKLLKSLENAKKSSEEKPKRSRSIKKSDNDIDDEIAKKKRKYIRKKNTEEDDNSILNADVSQEIEVEDQNAIMKPIEINNNDYEPDQLLKYGMKLTAKEARSLQKYYDNTLFGIWRDISRRDASKVTRNMKLITKVRKSNAKKLSQLINKESKKWNMKTTKQFKDLQIRARRGLREMSSYWKKNLRDEKDTKRKRERELLDNAKKQLELKEKERQNKQLEFLLKQSEIVSSFIAKKGNEDVLEEPMEDSATTDLNQLNFDELDDEAVALKAKEAAKNKIHDNMNGAELNFTNPNLTTDDQALEQPSILACTLKEYQLNGLRWLNSLYSMNVNGILADEMGLGKTVQSISMLANLAENHNIWGPFLVVTPVSTLHNWVQEIQKFVPDFKILPYWGTASDRKILRKFWDRKNLIYDKDKSEFHIMITSYQMIVNDIQYIKQLQWQYMILDEAQAIKSFQSQRWKNLLNINCKNKLLLTGTPIQNNLEELWALLHFIMPNFFQSIDNFNKIFNSDSNFKNSANLLRLHDILKPFMLRRVKKNVQKELEDKIEIDIMCDLTLKQKKMYEMLKLGLNGDYDDIERQALEQQLKQNAIENGENSEVSNSSTNTSTQEAGKLMNIVMEFRKVCNHPYLFESNHITSSFSFSKYGNNVHNIRNNTTDVYNTTTNEIEYNIPRLIYEEIILPNFNKNNANMNQFNVFKNYESKSLQSLELFHNRTDYSDCFESLDKINSRDLVTKAIELKGKVSQKEINSRREVIYDKEDNLEIQFKTNNFAIPSKVNDSIRIEILNESVSDMYTDDHYLAKWKPSYIEPCIAPLISTYVNGKNNHLNDPREIKALKTIPIDQQVNLSLKKIETPLIQSEMDTKPLNNNFITPNVHLPTIEKFIQDSTKLKNLDKLLPELKKGDHKCLIYFQMTKMMDMIEDYLTFKGYKYVRLDGSTTLERRRDLVSDFQTNDDIFIFLLSTRAGGLGINLVAADTVIFYDSDWNPTIDSQAMDRAHRLGQQRQVTVYRMICKNTIEQKMRDIANQKEQIQKLVMEGK
ncbi:uncharacterized protein HGUI_00589 [Hanseniaspora guilliermondii]|uniref:Chromatin-remodeling ATPase INO80 n=1 Tax=Hanseniaspora guilliermondii TaxID=56406 RepID=A0A1L0CHZ3_9ASCO|nr:uncharacterized protein HGUI_00589 [Hanseniaspora guilliermondii]